MRQSAGILGLAGSLLLAFPAVAAEEPCLLCSTAIITNSDLAGCFLDKFPTLAHRKGAAVAVDLSDCPSALATDRGVVNALPTLGSGETPAPDTEFILTPSQLGCLKAKLEEPGLVLDPQARIDLGTCG